MALVQKSEHCKLDKQCVTFYWKIRETALFFLKKIGRQLKWM